MELGKNTRTAIKWGCYLLLLLILCGFQSAPGLFEICGVKPVLIIPLVTAAAFFEREVPSAAFGLTAGFLWDVSAGKLFGFYGTVLMVCCIAITLLSMYCIRVNIFNYLTACLSVSLLAGLWDFLFYDLIWGYSDILIIFWKMLGRTVYTALLAAPVYYFVRWLTGRLTMIVRS